MLSSRERFWRTVRFEPVDHLPFWADWLGPVERWKEEGVGLTVLPPFIWTKAPFPLPSGCGCHQADRMGG